jgi:hypothetical protein
VSSDAPTTHPTKVRPVKSKGELLFDILLVLAIGGYLLVAQTYPPTGRQIPTVVGSVALIAAVVQLIGWFVPGMWKFSHGDPDADSLSKKSAAQAASEVTRHRPTALEATADAADDEPAAAQTTATDGKPLDVPIAMAWAGAFLGGILLIGYSIAVPLFFLLYFGVRRSWVLAVVSAVVMGLVTSVLFEQVLDIPMYSGYFILF